MKEKQQICLACFDLIPLEDLVCPQCGADLAAFSARDYREKLLHALFHPLADVRMRAVIALGWRGEPETADDLAACALRHPSDVVQGLEIINSLVKLKEEDTTRVALSVLKQRHPARAVRAGAARALAALPEQGETGT
jgi:HEAT repeats